MILTVNIGELGLQEEVAARNDPRTIGRRQAFTDTGLVVVPQLICGIDSTKTRAQRLFR